MVELVKKGTFYRNKIFIHSLSIAYIKKPRTSIDNVQRVPEMTGVKMKRNSELLNILHTLPNSMKQMIRNG